MGWRRFALPVALAVLSAQGCVIQAPSLAVPAAKPSIVLAKGQKPVGVALDDSTVYWIDLRAQGSLPEPEIRSVPKKGGKVKVLYASKPRGLSELAADDQGIYWLEGPEPDPGWTKKNGRVRHLPRGAAEP